MSKPRRAPEWPKALELAPTRETLTIVPNPPGHWPGPLVCASGVRAGAWTDCRGALVREHEGAGAELLCEAHQPRTSAEPIAAIALGTLQDGRHAALELSIRGREVVGALLLYASPEVARAAEHFHEAAFIRLFQRRAFEAYEASAHAPLEVAQLREGSAVALPNWKGKPAALAFDFDGRTVTEPQVVASGERMYAWEVLETWAAQNVLPRVRR